MSKPILNKTIAVLKVLLKLEDIEIMKYTIESLIEELEDLANKRHNK